MGGVYAFLAGVVAIIVAFIFGKRSNTTKISGEVTIQRERAEKAEAKAELSQAVSQTVAEIAKSQADVRKEIEAAEETIKLADKQRDTNAALDVARKLAEIAQGLL